MDKRIRELIDQSSTPEQVFKLFINEDGIQIPHEDIIAKHYDTKGKETDLLTSHNRRDILNKYYPNIPDQTNTPVRIRPKNEYQIGLEKEYKRAVGQWHKSLDMSSYSGCCFTLTIQPDLRWMKSLGSSITNRSNAVEKQYQTFVKELNQHLFKKPSKNKDKFIQSAYVIESQDRSGRDTNVHCHALLAINPMVARDFTKGLIDNVIKTKDFFWDNHKYKLSDTISDIRHSQSAGTDGWIEYILKNAPNPKLTDTADGSWLSNHTF